MPTPDTETLAARLRAVERALTDEGAVLDPSNGTAAIEEPGTDTAATHGSLGPAPGVNDRLCRLEAAVQALHAALDGCDTDLRLDTDPSRSETPESSGADTHTPDGPSETATEAAMDSRRDPREFGHDSRVPSATDWPDDLAAE